MTYIKGVTSEWFDAQVKHGNYLPNEKEKTNDEVEKIVRETIENYDPLKNKNLEELQELEDEFQDDKFILEYKQKRLNELKEIAKGAKYGELREIRYDNYKKEVNEASNDCFVVLLLHQEYLENSRVLNEIFLMLAKKFPAVKFLKIEATNCVNNFKDEDVPTVFIYKNGEIFKQFLPASFYFGGKNMTWKKVEWILNSIGVLKSDLESDPFENNNNYNIKTVKGNKKDDNSDSEEEKPSRWKI